MAKQKKLQLSPPPLSVDVETSLKLGIEGSPQSLEPVSVTKPSLESTLKLKMEETLQRLEPEVKPDPSKPSLNSTETIPASSPVSEPDINVPPNDDAEEQTDVLPDEGEILSNPSDSAIHGEKPVPASKSLPEALEKFSKCPITL